MADIPDEAIARRVEDVMQRDGEFDGAEPGGEMAAHLADGLDEKLAQFVGQRFELGEELGPWNSVAAVQVRGRDDDLPAGRRTRLRRWRSK